MKSYTCVCSAKKNQGGASFRWGNGFFHFSSQMEGGRDARCPVLPPDPINERPAPLFLSHKTPTIQSEILRYPKNKKIRAQSSFLLSPLGHFQPGARQAAKRRAITKQREEQLNQDQRAHFMAHIRGRRMHESGSLWI